MLDRIVGLAPTYPQDVMKNSKRHKSGKTKDILNFFLIVIDEMLNPDPTYSQVRWGSQSYIVLYSKLRVG